MPSQMYQEQLKDLGLSDKEASVYIASLQLPGAPIQKIAEKAGVKRATTYVAVESLMDRGLMSSYRKGKKTLFQAEPPRNLASILEREKAAIERKQHVLGGILSDLIAMADSSDKHPTVSFFEGIEGVRSIHEDILASKAKTLENVVSIDDVVSADHPRDHVHDFRTRLLKTKMSVRILYSGKSKDIELPDEYLKAWEVKNMDAEKNPVNGEITIYGDKIAAFSYRGNVYGAIIESREIAQTLKTLFNIAWSAN